MKLGLIALVSFTLGALVALWLNGDFQRPLLAQNTSDNPEAPRVLPLGISVPRVLEIGASFSEGNINAGGERETIVYLDGLNSFREAYLNDQGTRFVYGGGAFRLMGTVIRGPIRLELTGAAANTANLLKQFGILPSDSPFTTTVRIDPRETNKPIIKRKILPKPLKGDIASQYDGSKQ